MEDVGAPQQNPSQKRPLLLIATLLAVLLLAYVAFESKDYLISLIRSNDSKELLVTASEAQLTGDLDAARAAYEIGLQKAASGLERDRFLLRLASLELFSGNLNKGLVLLRDLSIDESVSKEIRVRAATFALQAYDFGRTTEMRDILFSGPVWDAFYPNVVLNTTNEQNKAIASAYRYTISIEDSIFARLYLSRYLALEALEGEVSGRKQLADESIAHYLVAKELQLKPEQVANWAPSQLGNMTIQKARAMIRLERLGASGLAPREIILEKNVRAVFEQVIEELSSDATDLSSLPYAMYARYVYASYLSKGGTLENTEAKNQLLKLSTAYPTLQKSQERTVQVLFATARVLGDESQFSGQPGREAIIAMAKMYPEFKTFLLDALTGWDDNDFK